MMFSNDKNVETIGQLVEVLKHYIGLQTEYVKLDVVDKVVRLLTALTVTVVLVGLLMMPLFICLLPWLMAWVNLLEIMSGDSASLRLYTYLY